MTEGLGGTDRRVAFVTGASRGIGRAAAIELARKGFDIVLTARTVSSADHRSLEQDDAGTGILPGSLEETAAEIEAIGRAAIPLRVDLLEPDSIDAAVEVALSKWGRIDVLVNNAIFQGVGLMAAFRDLDEQALRNALEGNFFSQLRVLRLIAPEMERAGGGVVINMTSTAAVEDSPGPVDEGGWGFAYTSSKAAFHKIVGQLHAEQCYRGVRFHNLDPGAVLTERVEIQFGGGEELDFGDQQISPPSLPAAAIAWLATAPEAEPLTGQFLYAQSLCRKYALHDI